jgi:hypothetical protein
LSRIVWGVVGNPFDAPAEKPNDLRVRKELELLYGAIDWSSVPAPFKPPFLVFRPGRGIDRLTASHLESWSSLSSGDEDEDADDE